MKKFFALLLGAVLISPALAACNNVQTFASQCAYIIQNGFFDAHHTKAIILPGQRYNANNTTAHYVYCNARNFIVGHKGADLEDPISAKTAPSNNGDGTPVDVQLSAYFSLNQNTDAMNAFLPFCEKYNCFSDKDTSNSDTSNHSSSDGWNNMLAENFPNAITRAAQHAMLSFPPNIWNDPGKWPKVADAIQSDFAQQMAVQTGSDIPFFCDQGATPSKCSPVRFSIEHVDPTDPAVRTTYNQQVEQQYARQLANQQRLTNQAELNAAKAKYGTLANQALMQQDTINACKEASVSCIVSLGNGSVSVQAPTK